jgi:hypothetical protein
VLVEALLALAVMVVEEAAAVEAAVEMVQDAIVASLAVGTRVALKLCVVPRHRVAGPVADEGAVAAVVVVRN